MAGAIRIVGIPLERRLRKVPPHPHVERIMQKQIRQQWREDTTLWRTLPTLRQSAFLVLRRGC